MIFGLAPAEHRLRLVLMESKGHTDQAHLPVSQEPKAYARTHVGITCCLSGNPGELALGIAAEAGVCRRLGRPPRISNPIEFDEREEQAPTGVSMTAPPHMFEELSNAGQAATEDPQQNTLC